MAAIYLPRSDWRPAIRTLPPGEAVAAVGDVHGHDDLFEALMGALAEELAGADRATFVQLGDLVDRGPASRRALLRAKAGMTALLPAAASVTLTGNHEDRMLSAASGDPEARDAWLDFGGRETLLSFGVSADDADWPRRLREALERDGLIDWLSGLPTSFRLADLFFVHAGLDPETPLARQQDRTLMWTRWPFLDSPGPYPEGVAVIHGHTPTAPVDLRHPHRLNLDTGAFRTGILSGLVIAGDRMRLVQAARA
ncbi:metallophosphoesterase [Chenggangzhangella methanolivorans]|uniref:Metallophosphoesterase n=1 Tax=Chenggangzhangella methanolivorans TaxID=1437009 RepID=A0A9E6REN8_9HYPH|nr:metallophosphoesterase [Chenggangzhangella methanolivorans]QZO02173.1 metallophosphoesterase [Chenggangzhangella methanolivorans]